MARFCAWSRSALVALDASSEPRRGALGQVLHRVGDEHARGIAQQARRPYALLPDVGADRGVHRRERVVQQHQAAAPAGGAGERDACAPNLRP